MKKILFIILIIVLVIIISIKVNYKSNFNIYFGNNYNEKYNYNYVYTRIEDLIVDIKKNIKINNRNIQNILVKSNNIIIDMNDLIINAYSLFYIEDLFKCIRKYSKENIIIYLRKEENNIDKNINNWIFKIKDKYDIIISR